MRFLIFSDSHGNAFNMRTVIERCIDDIDGVIFLGDIYEDAEILMSAYPSLEFHAVAGNCDASPKYLGREYAEQLFTVEGVNILILHGHRHMVKYGISVLEGYARSKGADVVLFGHTHEPFEKYTWDGEKPLYMFNPGSVARPRDGEASFGSMMIENGRILLSYGSVYNK